MGEPDGMAAQDQQRARDRRALGEEDRAMRAARRRPARAERAGAGGVKERALPRSFGLELGVVGTREGSVHVCGRCAQTMEGQSNDQGTGRLGVESSRQLGFAPGGNLA